MLAVEKRWARNDIGKNLVVASIKVAKNRGLEVALAEVTGPISRHLFIDFFEYSIDHQVGYKDYEKNGVKPFAKLEGSCVFAYKLISKD